jgi:serine/threonine-protein phosphatase 2A regulatory subunit B'
MVYNAMKLFMEVNPQLFDDCSHDYAESQNNASQRLQNRNDRWDKLAKLAEARQNGTIVDKPTVASAAATSPMRLDDSDPLSQGRLENLRLQDDASRDRRPKEYERQSSQTSVR